MSLRTGIIITVLALAVFPSPVRPKPMLVLSADDQSTLEIASSFKKSFDQPFDQYNLRGLEDEARKLGKGFSSANPELLIVVGNLATKMAKEYCPGCPVLYAAASNVNGLKLAGSKISGISSQPAAGKIIENIRLVFPNAQKIGVIYQPNYVGKEIIQLQAAAAKANLKMIGKPISRMKEIPAALNGLIPQIDLYLMLDDPGVITDDTFPFIFMSCFQKKLPIFAASQEILKKCAIAGCGYSPAQLGAELAAFASEMLGQKAGGKQKYPSAKLFLNKKIAQMYNFSFPAQASAQGVQVQ